MAQGGTYEALSAWIEERIRGRQLRWMVGAPSALGGLGTAAGAVLGLTLVVNLSLAFLCAWLAACVIALAIDRRTIRREQRETAEVLRAYGDRVRNHQETTRDLFHIVSWDEDVAVGKNGDTTIIRDLTLLAGPEPVSAIWRCRSATLTTTSGLGSATASA